MVFYAPESEGGGATAGLLTIGSLLVIIPIVAAAAFHVWPKTRMGKKFFLPEPDADQTFAAMPEFSELEQFRGQIGKTITELRPSGAVLVMGKRVDAKTEGLYVEAGRWVRITEIRAGQVTVRPLDEGEVRELPDDLIV
jgi:membrane-bound serine protease (ClpP class)